MRRAPLRRERRRSCHTFPREDTSQAKEMRRRTCVPGASWMRRFASAGKFGRPQIYPNRHCGLHETTLGGGTNSVATDVRPRARVSRISDHRTHANEASVRRQRCAPTFLLRLFDAALSKATPKSAAIRSNPGRSAQGADRCGKRRLPVADAWPRPASFSKAGHLLLGVSGRKLKCIGRERNVLNRRHG